MSRNPLVIRVARPIIHILTLLFIIALGGCGDSGGKDPLVISGVDMVPHTYQSGDNMAGLDVEIATAATDNAGIHYKLTMLEGTFTEAYDKTKAGPNRALLGINYSEARKDDFKWVGPISRSAFYIFAKKSAGIGQTISLESSRQIESIAVVTGWLETTTLENMGFKNLRYYASYEEAYAALDSDAVKALASDLMQMGFRIRGKYVSTDFDFCVCYKTAFYYMAVSKDVDDRVINSIQSSLDGLTTSGKTFEILKKYFPNAIKQMNPDMLQLFTELAPPFNYYTGPLMQYQPAGSSVDIVNEIQKRLGYVSTISLVRWFDGYANVLELPNSALFTTARTAERENRFQWVGPIATMIPRFYTLDNAGLSITTLEAAKALTVTTPYQWYTHDYLINNGFPHILATAQTPMDALNQLLNGEADALLVGSEAIDWLCNETGVPRSSLAEQPIEPPQQQGYIAFSLNTPRETVTRWQAALDAMKADGTFDNIFLNY